MLQVSFLKLQNYKRATKLPNDIRDILSLGDIQIFNSESRQSFHFFKINFRFYLKMLGNSSSFEILKGKYRKLILKILDQRML